MQTLPIDFDFKTPEILEKTISANSALAILNLEISNLSNFDLLLQPLTAREAVASSEIENIRTTTLELLQAELMKVDEMSNAQKETLNYKNALKKGFELVLANNKLGIAEIVEIQKIIVPEKANLRTRQVVIANKKGAVIYTPPKAEEIYSYLENLEKYFEINDDLDPLINMAITHYQFEFIHPFLDGNGRTGRILMILYLVLKAKIKYPVLFLSGYILEFKPYYYQLFAEVREHNNWTEWVMFFLGAIEIQAVETTARIKEIKALEAKFMIILKDNFNRINPQTLSNYFFSKAFYTQTNMVKDLGISRISATRYLEIMLEQGHFQTRKLGREKLYFIQKFIEVLS
jgi:Fic family protein